MICPAGCSCLLCQLKIPAPMCAGSSYRDAPITSGCRRVPAIPGEDRQHERKKPATSAIDKSPRMLRRKR